MFSRLRYSVLLPPVRRRSSDSDTQYLHDEYQAGIELQSRGNTKGGGGIGQEEEQPISDWPTKSAVRGFVSGYEFSISCWTGLCFVALIINISLTIAVAATYGFDHGLGTLYRGDCTLVERYNTATHLLINILSTSLLAGSNFCMQCLSAPTRSEVDKAHMRGKALDVGCPSLRNLFSTRRRKLVMWILFGMSSLPLHLFYNSVVYASISYNSYAAVSGNSTFMDTGTPFNASEFIVGFYGTRAWLVDLHDAARNDSLTQLDPEACIHAYANDYVSAWGNVILVPTGGDEVPFSYNSSLDSYSVCERENPMDWICQQETCDQPCRNNVANLANDASNWKPLGFAVDHCLAEPTPEQCSLLFSLPIALVVICFNITKAVLMILAAFYVDLAPLLTIGDAIQSFLRKTDNYTKANCLYDAKDFTRESFIGSPRPKPWLNKRRRFGAAPGAWRWLQAIVPWCIAIVAVSSLLGWGIRVTKNAFTESTMNLLQLGLGSVRSETVIDTGLAMYGPQAFIGNVLLANLPQVILSLVYFSYNALLTIMLAGLEWSKLPLKQKGLRVSKLPQGDQRSTYFLQLPYRYSLPLMMLSGILHWLISQAIFLVALEEQPLALSSTSEAPPALQYSCGWSPLAALLTIICGAFMMAGAVGIGLRRYPTGMPFGANSSVVLAAACHPDVAGEGEGLEYRRLKWGVVSHLEGDIKVEHCAMSSRGPQFPVLGELYA